LILLAHTAVLAYGNGYTTRRVQVFGLIKMKAKG
jgi:hypothetical protein